ISQQQEIKSPEPQVVHEIASPPATTKSITPPEQIQKPKVVAKKVEPPKQIAQTEEPKQYADVAEEIPRRPVLSSATVRELELRSQQKILKGKSLNHKGYALIKQGRPADAIPVLEQSVRAFPPEGKHDLNYAY